MDENIYLNSDDLEIKDRYLCLLKQYIEIAPNLADLLEKFGKIRKELQLLIIEIDKRKLTIEEPEELKKKVEELKIEDAQTH